MKKLRIEYVKAAIELVEGYQLISDEYINSGSKLEIMCPIGDSFWMNWESFKNGQRCPKCYYKKMGLAQTLSYEFVKQQIELEKDYKLISDSYINCHSNLKILCPFGDIFLINWSDFRGGHRCRKCYLRNNRGENNPSWNSNLTNEDREKGRQLYKKDRIEWIKAVYKRDNYTCQKCLDNTGGNLNSHHILPYALFPKIRWDVDNGVTLCQQCHIYYHSIYGKGLDCNHETMNDHLYL